MAKNSFKNNKVQSFAGGPGGRPPWPYRNTVPALGGPGGHRPLAIPKRPLLAQGVRGDITPLAISK